jgi:ribose-phosphate pyrophosphokinase
LITTGEENMKIIDLQNRYHCQTIRYPDGQPHLTLHNVDQGEDVEVVARITCPTDLYHLMGIANALTNAKCKKTKLSIPYLMGARSDRVMRPGDSVDTEMLTDVINTLGFESVHVFHPHSLASTKWIKNVVVREPYELLRRYRKDFGENPILIIPDEGAKEASVGVSRFLECENTVQCEKTRDHRGRITLNVLNPELCDNKRCVIVDDLCDGGGTFLAIASQIKPKHLTLIVTHGIFSKGTSVFKGKFNHIITSDSYQNQIKEPLVTTIKVRL